MLPLIIRGLFIIGGLIYALSEDEKKEEIDFPESSNCNDEFLAFSENLTITQTKKQQLIKCRNVLQKKIKSYFSEKANTVTPTFYIQGSYKHNTIIRKEDDTCDIDVGVYFSKKPGINSLSLHNNIVAAIGEHTNEKATIKSKCVRIYYANQFHIDLPVYYKKDEKFYIAVGNNGWREDDPKLFTNWFKETTKDNPQKVRIIKYFKAWSDFTKHTLNQKMPSGLAFTLWTLKHFHADVREDISFLKTAISLKNYLSDVKPSDWECAMPTVPNDSVIEKLTIPQRENFLNALTSFVDQATKLAASSPKDECLTFWKSNLGKWF